VSLTKAIFLHPRFLSSRSKLQCRLISGVCEFLFFCFVFFYTWGCYHHAYVFNNSYFIFVDNYWWSFPFWKWINCWQIRFTWLSCKERICSQYIEYRGSLSGNKRPCIGRSGLVRFHSRFRQYLNALTCCLLGHYNYVPWVLL